MIETPKIRRQGTDNLLAYVTVRCSGKMHKIGLAHNGQLILFDHTKSEIERHLTMRELGGEPVRCVVIYTAWVNGTINHESHPRELSQYRFPGYDIAKRVQRKLRRHRLEQQLSKRLSRIKREQLMQEYVTLVGPQVSGEEIDSLGKKIAKAKAEATWQTGPIVEAWFKLRVVDELVRRGWPTKIPKVLGGSAAGGNDDDDEDESEESSSQLFRVGYRSLAGRVAPSDPRNTAANYCQHPSICGIDQTIGDNIKITTGDERYVSSFSGKNSESMLLQLATDVAEVGYVNELIRGNRMRSSVDVSDDFKHRASKLEASSGIGGMEVRAAEAYGTMNLDINHTLLTPAATQLLIDAYRTIEPKVQAILSANAKRLSAENRFPPTPMEYVNTHGAVPKSDKVATIPVITVEEKVNDDDESNSV